MKNKIRRGDIYFVNPPKGVGSEQHGVRPVLMIQNDIGNMFSPTVIAAAMTSRIEPKDRLPTHVYFGNRFDCSIESIVMLEQIFTLDKQRLKSYFGCI